MLNLLNVIGSGSAIFLAFLVITVRRSTNTIANRWLGAFLLELGLFILDDSLAVFGVYESYPPLIGWFNLPLFALAPSLFLTVSQFVSVGRRFRSRDIWHFVPFLLFFLLSLPFLLSSDAIKLEVLASSYKPMDWSDKILFFMVVVQMVAYLFFSLQKLRKHRKNLENITAAPDEAGLNWLLYFLYGVIGMVMIWFAELFVWPTGADAGWYSIAYFAAVYLLGFFALRQKEVFPFSKNDEEEVRVIMEENTDWVGVRRSLFAAEKLEKLKSHLLEKLETEKPYLDPELNLPGLAHHLKLSVHEMSELVNAGFGENFAQFVNRYRVEESKRLLHSEKHAHLSMVGIAFEAGFNSKTAFNTAFKKLAGMSPTEYKAESAPAGA